MQMTSAFARWAGDVRGAHPGRVDTTASERPELLVVCGLAGAFGGIALVALAFHAGAVVPAHDPVAETLSDLGDGPSAIWMDLGFYLQAAGLVGLATGAAHAHLGRWGWSLGVLSLTGIALVVTLLGVFDDFHTRPVPVERLSVHTRLTYLLVPLYAVGPVAMAAGAARAWRPLGPLFLGAGAAMLALGPVFYLVPTSVDGLVERLLVLPGLVWTLALSALLLMRAQAIGRRGAQG